ncbi:MAG: carboxypeptidase-like regulatory domain-containing protein [Candidatus Micrarchaeia archaeon]
MVNFLAALAGLLLLISMPFAEAYSKSFVSDGWLEVTRTIEVGKSGQCPLPQPGVSDVCANTGASPPGGAAYASTLVTLSLRNIGPTDRELINVGESLSYVPIGSEISFSPGPSQFDGRQAVWEIAGLARGEETSLSYRFGSAISEAAAGRVPDPAVSASPSTVMLYAPSKVFVNGTLALSLRSMDGRPVSGARIVVDYPDGTRQAVRTDSAGKASMAATREGSYTYSVEGYRLYQMASTLAGAKEEEEVPAAAASAFDAGLLSGIAGALPIFAMIFAAAVVALIAYNFLTARREEEESQPAPPPLAESRDEQKGAVYSQNFSFAAGAEREKEMDDATRSMVESRKRRMQESEPSPPKEQEEGPYEAEQEGEDAAEGQHALSGAMAPEMTVSNGDMDGELAELERNARIAGEVAKQEKEVESMLVQLEQIRNKLRAGRGAVPQEAGAAGPESRPKPPARSAPASRAAPAKKQARQKQRRK